MRERDSDAVGFSLVEVIIAMFLLGIIAVAMIPVLWQGIRFSSEQSSVATATRHLNALIEESRENARCTRTIADSTLGTVPAVPNAAAFVAVSEPVRALSGVTFTDGKGAAYDVVAKGALDEDALAGQDPRLPYACNPGAITEIELSAVDSAGETIVSVTAKILMGS